MAFRTFNIDLSISWSSLFRTEGIVTAYMAPGSIFCRNFFYRKSIVCVYPSSSGGEETSFFTNRLKEDEYVYKLMYWLSVIKVPGIRFQGLRCLRKENDWQSPWKTNISSCINTIMARRKSNINIIILWKGSPLFKSGKINRFVPHQGCCNECNPDMFTVGKF